MSRELRVAHFGLGPIGLGIARLVQQTPGLRIVGATDVSPEKAGRDLGTLLGLPKKLRVKVEPDPGRLLRHLKADLAVLSTSSSLKQIRPQIAALVAKRLNVVSTCEELAFPAAVHGSAAREIDRLARGRKVSVLGTGVNPGFAMDSLALVLTAPCVSVERIAVVRVVDAATRRLPLQRKVGAGLTLAQFRRAMTEGSVRHVGLVESVRMIGGTLGWDLDTVEETLEPAVAPRDLDTEYLRIPAGAVAGIKQAARGYLKGALAVSLDLQMFVGAENPRDHVLVDGVPRIDMTIAGGIEGDVATAAMVVNCIPKLMAARPGLLTMRDLTLVHRFNPLEIKSLSRK